MSLSPEYPEVGPETIGIITSILNTNAANDVVYGNIMINAPSLADTYDPDTLLDPRRHLMTYWPGYSPDHHRYEAVVIRPEDQEPVAPDVQQMRNILLGASIGATALSRIPTAQHNLHTLADALTLGSGILVAEEVCRAAGVPLGVVDVATVASSNLVEAGAQVGYLWYPTTARPKQVLGMLKMALRRTIANENV